ncbi:WD40 repeat domain-containing protein [Symmachiella dynata]|nr:WD40 repeat domain-containing protein [Symmachiella dynata]
MSETSIDLSSIAFSGDSSTLVVVKRVGSPRRIVLEQLFGHWRGEFVVFDLSANTQRSVQIKDGPGVSDFAVVIPMINVDKTLVPPNDVLYVQGLSSWDLPRKSASRHTDVKLGLVRSNTVIKEFPYTTALPTKSIAIDSKMTRLAICNYADQTTHPVPGEFELWKLNPPELLIEHKSDHTMFNSTTISPDGNVVVAGGGEWIPERKMILGKLVESGRLSYRGELQFWNTADGKKIREIQIEDRAVRCLDYSPDGKFVVTGFQDASVAWWSVANGDEVTDIRFDKPSPERGRSFGPFAVQQCVFSPDGRLLAVSVGSYNIGSKWGELHIVDTETMEVIETVWKKAAHVIGNVVFSPDGKMLAAVCLDGTLMVWGVQSR